RNRVVGGAKEEKSRRRTEIIKNRLKIRITEQTIACNIDRPRRGIVERMRYRRKRSADESQAIHSGSSIVIHELGEIAERIIERQAVVAVHRENIDRAARH